MLEGFNLKRKILVSRLFDHEEFQIVPLHRKREWMNLTQDSYAYQCMPLNIANDYGWAVLSPTQFTATWNGKEDLDAIKINYAEEGFSFAHSHFGHGVLTISVDFVLRTPPKVSTYIRGIPNEIIDGLQPLDAIVETDWLPFTFTYNYKFLKPCTVRFEKNEPLFSFFPIKRGDIESYSMSSEKIEKDSKFYEEYEKYAASRQNYLDNMNNPEIAKSTQRYYMNAKDPDGNNYEVVDHIKRVQVAKPKGLNLTEGES
jgi:hypothetical protein